MNQVLRDKLTLLPAKPGVYLMKDESGNIIYVEGEGSEKPGEVLFYRVPRWEDPTVGQPNLRF